MANYDCSQLVGLGEERCESVYGGGVCQWKKGKDCHPELKCQRVPYYEQHYKYSVDVGRCVGVCDDKHKCKPKIKPITFKSRIIRLLIMMVRRIYRHSLLKL